MKKAMSNVDVAALVVELQGLVGGHVGKAYQIDGDTVWLTVQVPSKGRKDLVLEASRRVHLTSRPRKVSKIPPQFPVMLRSQLSGGRIVAVEQYDFDRVIEITVERGGVRRLLIAELFPKGNVVLLDDERRIILPLRPMVFKGRKVLGGEEYIYHQGQRDPRSVSSEDLKTLLDSSDADLVRTLVRGLNMGGVYGEEVCLQAGLDKNVPASGLADEDVEAVHLALREVFVSGGLEPQVVYKDGAILDVVPRSLGVYKDLEPRPFDTFSEALDAFFVEKEPEVKKTAIDRRLDFQRKAIQEFEAMERDYVRAGEFVYERYIEVEALLKVVSSARDKGFTYSQIFARIKASGLPQADMLRSMDYKGEVVVDLDGQELELNAELTVPQNAQRYYDKAKEMAKKREGAWAALETTVRLKEGKAGQKKTRGTLTLRRQKPRWYERFRWFESSDGFLVIGGRDSDANEEIYAKYLEKRDLALHTDAPGAPLTVIKTGGAEVPEATVQEAAQFAVSYSNLWKGGLYAGDCYLVKGDQVTKTPETGEYLRKGGFVIRGERRYFRDVPVGVAVALAGSRLIGGPVSAVRSKAKEAEDDGDGGVIEVVELEPGEFNADDLAKRIYRDFADRVEDRRALKVVASVEQIVSFLPPGGSRVKGT